MTDKLKIATSFGSLNPGGGEKQNCNLLIAFKRRGHDVYAVLPNGAGYMEGNLKPYLEDHGIPMTSVEHIPDKTQGMTPVFRTINPDVSIHAGYPMTLHGALSAFKAGVRRRIIRMETAGLVRQQNPQDDWFELLGNSAADYVIGNSNAVVDSFDLYHGICDCKRLMIPNGVDIPVLDGLRDLSRQHWGVGDKTVLIGHLANFRRDGVKNQLMLVRAAKRLVEAGADFRMVMCGYRTDYQDKVESAIAEAGVEEYVKIPGRLSDIDMIAGWDIGVNASTTEGFSNALQECMAYGMPIVVTDAGGNREAVEANGSGNERGFIVESDDDEGMAAELLKLINSKRKRTAMGKAARQYMEDNFGWDAICQQWEALFE